MRSILAKYPTAGNFLSCYFGFGVRSTEEGSGSWMRPFPFEGMPMIQDCIDIQTHVHWRQRHFKLFVAGSAVLVKLNFHGEEFM